MQFISGRSSYELAGAVREFYSTLGGKAEERPEVDIEAAVKRREMEIAMRCLEAGMTVAKTAEVLGKHPNTISNWRKKANAGLRGLFLKLEVPTS